MSSHVGFHHWVRGLVGGVLGGVIGCVAFVLLARQGLYALALPGAALGFGCGMLSGVYSQLLGAACGSLALVLGLLMEWHTAPFIDDQSLLFFVTHVHQLRTITLVMILLGGLCGFWMGKGRERLQQSPV